MNDDENEESPKKAEWDAKERKIRREDADRNIRLVGAINDCRKIADSMTSGDYREYIMRSSRGIVRDFRPGVNIEEQLAEEHILRALFGVTYRNSEGKYVSEVWEL